MMYLKAEDGFRVWDYIDRTVTVFKKCIVLTDFMLNI